jgi:hypothetical protein
MWMWILISLVVVAVLAGVAAIVFINAVGSAYSIFSAPGSRPSLASLLRWPENLWPRKVVLRFPLPNACRDEADRGKPPPDLTVAEIAKAADAFSVRAEAIIAAHKGPKPENAEEFLAAARSMRAKAAEHHKRGEAGKAGELSSAWVSYSESCQYYELVLSDLTSPSRQ